MGRLKITQVKSAIKRPRKQKLTLEALGIRGIHHTVEHEDTPQINGMVNAIAHLVSVEEV